MSVTRATVESHLHSSYRKLDITTRAQLHDAIGGSAETALSA